MGGFLKPLEFVLKYGLISVLLILWVLWAWYHWRIFHPKNGDKPDAASIRRLNWLKQDRWSEWYRNWLGTLLDWVSAVIGDAGQGGENRLSRMICHRFGFDHNPWTEPSFNLLFRIALIYPLLSFIVFWLMGGSGYVGAVELLPDNAMLSVAQRWGIGIALFLGLFGLFFLIRYLRALSDWNAGTVLSTVVFLLLLPCLVEYLLMGFHGYFYVTAVRL